MIKAPAQKGRTFSKKLTLIAIWNLTVITILGMLCGFTDLPGVLIAYIGGVAIFVGMYMQIGHSYYRVSKGLPGLMDALSALAGRRKGPPNA